MRTIYKYQLEATRRQIVRMPLGAQILTVGLQGDNVCLWAMVDPEARASNRVVECYGTGHDITEPDGLIYIGTTIDMSGSPLVFHFFERGTVNEPKGITVSHTRAGGDVIVSAGNVTRVNR